MSFSEWKEVTLGEISVGNKGSYGIAASAVDYSENLYTYLRITDITDDGVLKKDSPVSVDDYDAKNYLLKPNDIVFARTGNSTGRSYFYDGTDGELVYAGFLIKFSLDPIKVNPKFIRYYTLSDEYKNWVASFSTGSTRGNINAKTYGNMKIQLPSRKQQDFLVNILSTLDEKIEVNNKINKTLENMAQSIFKEWFVDFEFPNEDGEPYKSSGGEMIESELGMIPKGWEVIEFGNIVRISSKSVKPMENKSVLYEHYSIPALDEKTYPKFELGDEIKSNKFVVFSDSILISKLNPRTKRIWRPFCISTNSICSTEFINFIPIRKGIHEFAYGIIDSNEFSDFLMNHATGSTGSRQRVKPNDALKFKLVYPNNQNILTKHFETSKNIYDEINNNIVENQKLTEIRDSLLPKLMSGEIRVPF